MGYEYIAALPREMAGHVDGVVHALLANVHAGLGARGLDLLHALATIVSAEVGEPVVLEEA